MEKANFGQIVSFLFGIANDCLVDTYDVGDYNGVSDNIVLEMTECVSDGLDECKNFAVIDRLNKVISDIEEEYENENLINEAVSALSIDNNDVEVDDVDLE